MSLSLNFIEKGNSKKSILLLHGLFGSSANWNSIGAKLEDQYRVIIPDLRNHGQSPQSSVMSYRAVGQDIITLIDKLNISKCLLLGHSMGGKVAMQVALTYPERINGLSVIDMAPVNYNHNFERIFRGFDSVDLDKLKTRSDAIEQMETNIPEMDVRQFLLKNLIKTHTGWKWRLNIKNLRDNQKEITKFSPPQSQFRGPSWFLHGTKSDYLLPHYEPSIFKLFPRAQIFPIYGAGHWVHTDRPDLFWACVEKFLAVCNKNTKS
tara:strand:+ start:928 stop:1719 length:792 start_codon:yes stop_codon:yes gene_type:complete